MGYSQGSWNMMTTSSTETWTSAHVCHGLERGNGNARGNTTLNALGAVADGGFEACERDLGEAGRGLLRVACRTQVKNANSRGWIQDTLRGDPSTRAWLAT